MNQILVSQSAGFCIGVKNAIRKAEELRASSIEDVFTMGPLLHNDSVIKKMEKNGIHVLESIDKLKNLSDKTSVVVRSHGVSENVLKELTQNNKVINATCGFVLKVQKLARKYYDEGYQIVVVGDKNHPEIIGINGWCYDKAVITKDGKNLEQYLLEKVCLLAQTTERKENFENVEAIVRTKCKNVIVFNTICKATSIRQKEAVEISKTVDKMLVIGGRNSANTKKLFDICLANCKNTIHVEYAAQIPENFYVNNKVTKIGVTAGASTPDWIIKEAILKMMDEKNFETNELNVDVDVQGTNTGFQVNIEPDNQVQQLETNEQLAYMEANDRKISVGQILKGEIISINENEVFMNINYKADGILPSEEAKAGAETLAEAYSVGDVFDVKVLRIRNEDGYVVLSQRELLRDAAYDELKLAYENKTHLDIVVKELVKGGVVASYNGVRIFIPASHIEISHVEDLSVYLNKTLTISIIEFEEVRKNLRIIGSRRAILKEERQRSIDATWAALEKGQIVEGTVQRITEFGAFVDVQGVDGLLHVSEISWGRVERPSDVLEIGEKITAKVIEVDKDEKKLSLSTKILAENPWDTVEEKYPVDGVVLGKVVRFADFGAFVELEPGIDGLVHVSEISHKRIEKPSDVLSVGEQIKAKIIDVNKSEKKIGLSIKAVEEL